LALLLAVSSTLAQSSTSDPHHGHDHGRHDATATHRFDDADEWAEAFENPERGAWQLPDRVVSTLVTRDDLVIADIGSATGYFPMRFARAVPNGRVYGADIEPSMVFYLNDRARRAGLTNLTSILAAPDDPHLPCPVDLVFLCNTYHHIDDRIGYMSRLGDGMNPGFRVAIVDFRLESEKGPPHKLDPDVVREEMTKASFEEMASYEFLPEQYFLLFERQDTRPVRTSDRIE
jgi:SAM-dependent methyltransferase